MAGSCMSCGGRPAPAHGGQQLQGLRGTASPSTQWPASAWAAGDGKSQYTVAGRCMSCRGRKDPAHGGQQLHELRGTAGADALQPAAPREARDCMPTRRGKPSRRVHARSEGHVLAEGAYRCCGCDCYYCRYCFSLMLLLLCCCCCCRVRCYRCSPFSGCCFCCCRCCCCSSSYSCSHGAT